MLRRVIAVVLVVGAVLAMPQLASALIAPTEVFDPQASQALPYRNATYLLYSANTKDRPRHWDAFVRPVGGGTPTKVNASATKAFAGGFDPGTNVVIYQEYSAQGSDIRLFDVDTKQRLRTPRPMHTGAWEFDPHISTSFMSFFRWQLVKGVWYANLYLLDRSDDSLTKITSVRDRSGQYLLNDFLGEHYVTWTVCAATCVVRVYNIDAPAVTKLPSTADNKPQYASTIDETGGVLFFVRSGFGCGLGVNFWSVPTADLSAVPTKVASLPAGEDVANSSSLDAGDLLFGKYPCGGWAGVYALLGAAT
jgi:hypothetical protein